MKKLKVAVVGCGGMAKKYNGIYNSELSELTMLIDTNEELVKNMAAELNVPKWSVDFNDCLSDEIDVVDISTPNFLHAEQAIKAIEAGKHVLIQKPVAVSVEETQKIVSAAQKNPDVKVGVYMQHRGNPVYREIKEIIKSGLIGQVVSTRARRSYTSGLKMKPGTWRGDVKKTGGGSFMQLAVHSLDICMWMLESKISHISAISRKVACENIGGDDITVAMFEYDNGVIGTVETSYCSTGVETAVYGTEGYIILNELGAMLRMNLNAPFNGRHIKYTEPRKMIEIPVGITRDTMYTADNRYEQHLEFLRCVAENKPFSVDMNEALYDMKLVETVYKSSECNKRLDI